MVDRRIEPTRTERVQRLKETLRERLQGICSHFPEAEFEALIERIAQLEIKYTMRADALAPPEIAIQALRNERFKN